MNCQSMTNPLAKRGSWYEEVLQNITFCVHSFFQFNVYISLRGQQVTTAGYAMNQLSRTGHCVTDKLWSTCHSLHACITNDEEIVFGSLLYSPEEVDIHYSRNLWANLEITAIQPILLADAIAFACISSFIARHVFHFLQMLNPKTHSHLITRKLWKRIIQKTGSYASLLNKLP